MSYREIKDERESVREEEGGKLFILKIVDYLITNDSVIITKYPIKI